MYFAWKGPKQAANWAVGTFVGLSILMWCATSLFDCATMFADWSSNPAGRTAAEDEPRSLHKCATSKKSTLTGTSRG